jgi:uncharacterized protein (DUF433 family)
MSLQETCKAITLKSMSAFTPRSWKYLAPDPKSPRYRQLFIKGRRIAARALYGMYVSQEEPKMTIEEIAADYDLPVEAVLEAIAYCESNLPELQADREADELLAQVTGMNDPAYKYNPSPKRLTPQEKAQLNRP